MKSMDLVSPNSLGRLRWIQWALVCSLAIIVGVSVGMGLPEISVLTVAAVFGLAFITRLSIAAWCVLTLIATVVVRAPVEYLGLPSLINFMHYPIVGAFALVATFRGTKMPIRVSSPASRWILVLMTVVSISMWVNLSHPVRALIFILILGEPLLLIWAIHKWPVDQATMRTVVTVAICWLVLQVPIGVAQGLILGWQDPVQGTLVGHGAGAHVLGALLALGLFGAVVGMAYRTVRRRTAIVAIGVAVTMMMAAGAAQVVIAAGAALAMLGLAVRSRSFVGGVSQRAGLTIAALGIATLSLVALEYVIPKVLERAEGLITAGRFPELIMIEDRGRSNPVSLIVGSGPGTTASRASLLLTPALMKEDSPLGVLQLPATEEGLRLANQTSHLVGGSAESFASSSLGILGDLGIMGVLVLVAFFVSIWRQAGRGFSALGAVIRLALMMTFILMFVDNWLEYPEYSLPFAVLIAFGLSSPGNGGGDGAKRDLARLESVAVPPPRGTPLRAG